MSSMNAVEGGFGMHLLSICLSGVDVALLKKLESKVASLVSPPSHSPDKRLTSQSAYTKMPFHAKYNKALRY